MIFLAYYKDEIKSELIKFKQDKNHAVTRWLTMIAKLDIASLPKVDYIVRALGSKEIKVKSSPIDKIGIILSSKLKAPYIPQILEKKETRQLKFLNRQERMIAIKNSYKCVGGVPLDKHASILVIDDVITTGATGNEISKVLKETYGSGINIYYFALVQTPLSTDYGNDAQQYNHKFYKQLMQA